MNKKQMICTVLALIVAAGAFGTGGYFIGTSNAQSSYQAEGELNIKLSRSDLDGLGEIEGTIYVTGHKSPDSDTVGSSIAYAELLKQSGYDAKAVVAEKVNRETEYILKTAGLNAPEILKDASGYNIVLVDHSEYTQSVNGLENANILSIIDHHNDGAVTTGNQIIYDARPLGSTATIIWLRYRNYGLEPDKQTATVMLGAILSDTSGLKSDASTFADREAVKTLSGIAGIPDTDSFFQEMLRKKLSYDGMTDEEIFLNDYKEYVAGGTKYGIGVIDVYDEESAKAMTKRMKDILPDMLSTTGMDMLFAQVSVFHDDFNITYIVPSGEAESKVIETAFGNKAAFDGLSYEFRPGMSRKKVLVPAITKTLESQENSVSGIKADAAVSYLGPEGTYTEEAAKFFFKDANSLIPKKTVDEAIEEVKNGSADYAVIPQENTLGGAVTNYVDALIRETDVYVVGEVIIPINQTLMGVEGASLAGIKTVCSHSQGLTQSKTWRTENLPDAEEKEMDSTAAAASFVAESKDKSIAAVAAPGAAELYDLTVLAENVQISDTNKTRFYVLSKTKNESGKRAVFIANCGADQIDDIIVELNSTGFEMVALHDRPDGTKLGSYNYVIETEADNISNDMIDKITAHGGVRFAGCFDLSEKTNS